MIAILFYIVFQRYYHASFQDLNVSVATASSVRASTILLLLIILN